MITGLIIAILILGAFSGLLIFRMGGGRLDGRGLSAYFPLLFCLWIVSIVFWNTYLYSYPLPGLFDISIDRALFLLLVALAVLIVLFKGKRFEGGHRLEFLMLAFLFVCLASMSVHGFKADLPIYPKPWFIFYSSYVVPFFAFIFAKYYLNDEKSIRLFMLTLFLVALYLCVVAFFEHYGLKSLIFPAYITDPNIPLHLDRARGPFLNAAFNGLAITAGLVGGAFLWPWLGFFGRLAGGAMFLLFFPAIFFTQTRSAYLSFLIVLATLMFFLRSKGERWKLYPLFISLCLIALLANFNRLFSESREAGGLAQIEEVDIRFQLINRSLRLIEQNPILGVGLAQFAKGGDSVTISLEPQHNHLIGMAVELGMVGLALYLVILATIFARLHSLTNNPLIRTDFYANTVLLLALGVTVHLVTNVFVEPSFSPYDNIITFSLAGIIENLADHPGLFADSAKAFG